MVFDDLDVKFEVRKRNGGFRKLLQVFYAADVFEFLKVKQFFGNGLDIDRDPAILHILYRPKHNLIRSIAKVKFILSQRTQRIAEGLWRYKHRAKDSFFGIDVIRK